MVVQVVFIQEDRHADPIDWEDPREEGSPCAGHGL